MSAWLDLALLATLALILWAFLRVRDGLGELDASLDSWESMADRDWQARVVPARLLRQCGLAPHRFGALYWAAKLLLGALLPLALAELGFELPPFVYAVAAVLGLFTPDLALLSARRSRRQRIERNLAYFIDLMVAFLSSGATLAHAFDNAARHGLAQDDPLAGEVLLVANELEAGLPHQEGFRRLADRTGVVAIVHLAALLEVGQQTGTAIGETLRAQSELLRARMWEQAEALLNRKSLQALIPLALVSLPLLGVLIFFPAAVQLMEAFSLFREVFV